MCEGQIIDSDNLEDKKRNKTKITRGDYNEKNY